MIGLALLGACSHRPIEELALADVAVKAAQKVKADSLAPDTFRKAENYYLRAKKDYTEGYYDSARRYADDARLAAEQAEYRALIRQASTRGKSAPEEPTPAPPPPPGSDSRDGGGASADGVEQ